MFRNIGRKIKGLALVLFWISLAVGVLAALAGAIYFFIRARRDDIYVLLGILVLFVGCGVSFLISWIGSFFMYGFGQLIDDTEINRHTNEKILARLDGGAAVRGGAPNPVYARPVAPPVPETPAAPVPETPVAPVPETPAAPVPEGTWFCKRCGARNEAVAKFCFRCGLPNDNA